jgi:hypothetical protein
MQKILAVVIIVLGGFMLSVSTVTAQLCNPNNPPCEGDLDCDCDVDAQDVFIFLSNFGRSPFNFPCPPCASSAPAPVEKSGQTTSYATGDDGDLEKGVAWPNPRFTDNLDGTITDNLTGLIWLKDANCFGVRTWDQALSVCNGLASGSCGLTDGSIAGDWRLPNSNELTSLVHKGYALPALPNTAGTGQWSEGDPFNNVDGAPFYWSSTTYAGGTDFAWHIYLGAGRGFALDKTDPGFVWPVRGGH